MGKRGMRVLSLFDGISCGKIALARAGLRVDAYYASEIKPIALKVSEFHHPDIIRLGDVTKIHFKDGILYTEKGNFDVGKIDLLLGGSPCQDFSCAASRHHKTARGCYGLEGDKSRLFYEYLRIKEEVGAKYFLLENVKMKKSSEEELSNYLEVEPICINSSRVSFQSRNRLYWTNIPNVKQPKDMHINFQDYIDDDLTRLQEAKVNKTPSRIRMWNNGEGHTVVGTCNNVTHASKVGCLTRFQDAWPNSGLIEYEDFCRTLTRRELEFAQTIPIGYCDLLSYRQTCDVLGDAWTVDVIAHILRGLRKNKKM